MIFVQRGELGFTAEDGIADLAGERSASLDQGIGAVGVKAGRLRDAGGEKAETTRHQSAPGAVGGHGGD